MAINSKAKGSKNEREVAKLMEAWSGYEFARTPQSGGLHWKKQHTTGDIVCIDEKHGRRFGFSIECKFYEDLTLLPLITGAIGRKSTKILGFWDQTLGDAITARKIPLLFMRKNGMKKGQHFVVMDVDFIIEWEKANGDWGCINGRLGYADTNYKLGIINSDDLFQTEYLAFHKAARKLIKQRYGTK